MRNICLLIEFEGTHYFGWQRQARGPTVQQRLEEAIERITGADATVIGAGRTDSGVHALGMVVSFRTCSDMPMDRLRDGLNGVLPGDIAVLDAEDAPEDFHAQYSAKGKRYEYSVWPHRVRPVFDRERTWHVRWPLDVDLMNRGAAEIVGRRDFAAFQASGSAVERTVRTVFSAEWGRRGRELVFGIEGDGFLYNMVRIAVGSLVDVGRGKTPLEQFIAAVDSGDRTLAGPTAPAKGLCLVRVDY